MKSGTNPNSPAQRWVGTTGQPTRSATRLSSELWMAGVVSSLVVNSSSSAVSRCADFLLNTLVTPVEMIDTQDFGHPFGHQARENE